jgi:hypothetical protein
MFSKINLCSILFLFFIGASTPCSFLKKYFCCCFFNKKQTKESLNESINIQIGNAFLRQNTNNNFVYSANGKLLNYENNIERLAQNGHTMLFFSKKTAYTKTTI